MTLQEMIEKGHEVIADNNDDYYYWIDVVETYLKELPNQSYISRTFQAIDNCKQLGFHSSRRKEYVNQIIAVLKRIYDNEQEKFLQENVSAPLLSIFADDRMHYVQVEFEKAVQYLNENRYPDALNEIFKAEESMMKEVCTANRIQYGHRDTYGDLMKKLEVNGILPINDMLMGHQRLRNATSAHGATVNTYIPDKKDVIFEINRGAALLIYLYNKSNFNT